ncbi:choline/ethanolamine kinase [Parasteatoda tepidariorum]|uniref:choline/ethanolamine kinase n=1 Tax=Parasteatoda tepidariorum TaxID=114398 RepID=UPI001C719822|nr:choline/ethanolamine kinase [Parasteatoda tepidariorum]
MAINGTTINGNDAEQEAFKLCQEFLGSPWNNMDISNFRLSVVNGGLSNKLYCCTLANPSLPMSPKVPERVLLRIYGPLQDEEHRKVVEAATFVLLAEKNLGPKMYGIFPTGRLEEYIPSKTLNQEEMRLMLTKTARMLAKIHTLDVPVRKVPDLWGTQINKWLHDVEKDAIKRNKGKFSLSQFYREEIQWLTKEMENSNSPTAYCHNDLLGGNILLREDSKNKLDPDIVFIDFEFGGYNYRAYDIANHFSEWIYEYHTPDPPHFVLDINKYPSKEERVSKCTVQTLV